MILLIVQFAGAVIVYFSYEVAERIKHLAKTKKIPLKTMLSDCGLGINYISEVSKGKDMTTGKLYAIAEYLDCSADYLLGRAETPEIETAAPVQLDESGANVMLLAGRNGQQMRIRLTDEQYDMIYKMFCSFPDADETVL